MTDNNKLSERDRWIARILWQAARSTDFYGSSSDWLNASTIEDGVTNAEVLARDAPPFDGNACAEIRVVNDAFSAGYDAAMRERFTFTPEPPTEPCERCSILLDGEETVVRIQQFECLWVCDLDYSPLWRIADTDEGALFCVLPDIAMPEDEG